MDKSSQKAGETSKSLDKRREYPQKELKSQKKIRKDINLPKWESKPEIGTLDKIIKNMINKIEEINIKIERKNIDKNESKGIQDFYKQHDKEQKLLEYDKKVLEDAKNDIGAFKNMLGSPNSILRSRAKEKWNKWKNYLEENDERLRSIATTIVEAIHEVTQQSQENVIPTEPQLQGIEVISSNISEQTIISAERLISTEQAIESKSLSQVQETPQTFFSQKGWFCNEQREMVGKLPLEAILAPSDNSTPLSKKLLRKGIINSAIKSDLEQRVGEKLTILSHSNNSEYSEYLQYYQKALNYVQKGVEDDQVEIYWSQVEYHLYGVQDVKDKEKTIYITNTPRNAEDKYNLPKSTFSMVDSGRQKKNDPKYIGCFEDDGSISHSNRIILYISHIKTGQSYDGKNVSIAIDKINKKIYMTDSIKSLLIDKLGKTQEDYDFIKNSKDWTIMR